MSDQQSSPRKGLSAEQIEGFRIVLRNWLSRDSGQVQAGWEMLCDMALESARSEIGAQPNAAAQVVAQTDRASGKSAEAEDTEGHGFEPRQPAAAASSGDKSDTPRTDEVQDWDNLVLCLKLRNLCRQLERELNAALSAIAPTCWLLAVEEDGRMRTYGGLGYRSLKSAQEDAELPRARGQRAEIWACYALSATDSGGD